MYAKAGPIQKSHRILQVARLTPTECGEPLPLGDVILQESTPASEDGFRSQDLDDRWSDAGMSSKTR